MTNLEALAKTPQAFDAKLAELHGVMQQATDARDGAMNRIHSGAGDRQDYVTRSRKAWRRTHAEVIEMANMMANAGQRGAHNIDMVSALVDHMAAEHKMAETLCEINEMDAVYAEHRWTRFFPSVTKSQPHIHRTLSCHTLHPTTVMSWAPGLSGKTDEEAVAELDEALCTVCFPTAPVALHNYVSRRSQAERDARQVEKDARDAIKARKNLTEAEQFKTQGRFGERVTTVAKCLELVRKAVELEVELEYWTQVADGTRSAPQGWTTELLARRVSNISDSLSEARVDAAEAEARLLAREAAHEGYGATAQAIAKTRASKLKSARKDWL